MRGRTFYLAIVLVWILSLLPASASAQNENLVLVLSAQGPLTPAMAEYLDRGLAQAARDNAQLVIFQLDTPGGAIDLMNRMVQSIRASAIPVVVYIAPRGAMAGSAAGGLLFKFFGPATFLVSAAVYAAAGAFSGAIAWRGSHVDRSEEANEALHGPSVPREAQEASWLANMATLPPWLWVKRPG